MAKNARTKGWLAFTGVALLMAALAVPALAGAASASPAPAVAATSTSPSTSWAYGGEGWSNGSITLGNTSETWTASYGWTVIFTATANNATGVLALEAQRTVGVDLTVTWTAPLHSLVYHMVASESDAAFANLTTAASVYVNGAAVAALGILNASASAMGSFDEALVLSSSSAAANPVSLSAFLNVTGTAAGSVQFAPALGLIPLNLTGVQQWNSSAVASPSASWTVAYAFADHGLNGSYLSGNATHSGNWSRTGTVSLSGFLVSVHPVFRDHQTRTAVVLILQGGADLYDGFIVLPHGFDLFGGAGLSTVPVTYGTASIASGEVLFLTPGRVSAESLTAAQTTFGSSTGSVSLAQPVAGAQPAASGPSGTAVTAQPMSVAQAQAESGCLANGCAASPAAAGGAGGLLVALIAAAVVVVVGTVGVVEWRAYARRKQKASLVGGYGESWPNGVPPAAAAIAPQAPLAPMESPSGPSNEPPKL
jgi:hypothetical protein